jgi:hypothetical protein
LKVTAGQMTVLNHRGKEWGSFSYSPLSVRAPRRSDCRRFNGASALFLRNMGNMLGGMENALFHHKVELVAEWMRGQHDFGFFLPGIIFRKWRRRSREEYGLTV